MRYLVKLRYASILLIALSTGIGGCVDLKPRADATRYFVLGSDVQSTGASAGNALSVGIQTFSIAPYLDSPRIATRVEDVEITYSANGRWGEQLDTAIQKRLVAELGSSDGIGEVFGLPWPQKASPARRLAVSVDHFEGRSDSTVSVGLSWTVTDRDGMTLDRGSSLEQIPGWIPGDYRIW